MKEKLILEKGVNSVVLIIGICLFFIPITSCNSPKNSTNELSVNVKKSLLKQEINKDASNPKEVVEEFMRVSSDDLENAYKYVSLTNEDVLRKEDKIQEIPQSFDWVPDFKRMNLFLENISGEQINKDKSIVDVELGNKDLKNKGLFRFYLKRIKSEWRIYKFEFLGGKLSKRNQLSI